MRIKDWNKFQHFKDRRPPWIKLYRDLLDDPEWHELDPASAKVLVMIWLIASEEMGELPTIKKLAFRLRMSEKQVEAHCLKLSHWLELFDTEVISERYQHDAPETETETEKRQIAPDGFDVFWKAYPKKVGKPAAIKAYKAAKLNGSLEAVLKDVAGKAASESWMKQGGQFIPNPSTYLNQRRWEDLVPEVSVTVPAKETPLAVQVSDEHKARCTPMPADLKNLFKRQPVGAGK